MFVQHGILFMICAGLEVGVNAFSACAMLVLAPSSVALVHYSIDALCVYGTMLRTLLSHWYLVLSHFGNVVGGVVLPHLLWPMLS